MEKTSRKVAVVTGANKGVGLAIVKKLCKDFNGDVYLTSRNEENGCRAVAALEAEGLSPKYHQLDIASAESVKSIAQHIFNGYGGVDVLVNNAAIAYKAESTILFVDQARETVDINFTGTLQVSRAFIPMIRPHGRIVNVSSAVSSLSLLHEHLQERFMKPSVSEHDVIALMDEFLEGVAAGNHTEKGWASWPNAIAKIAVNAVTRIHAKEMVESEKEDVIVNACCPGWVKTDMADEHAPLSPDQGAETPVYLALLPPGSPTGQFWIDKEIVEWKNVRWTWYNPKTYKW